MNRFEYDQYQPSELESIVKELSGVKIYDGSEKVSLQAAISIDVLYPKQLER